MIQKQITYAEIAKTCSKDNNLQHKTLLPQQNQEREMFCTCDGPNDDYSAVGIVLLVLDVLKEQVGQEEVAQVVSSHTDFKAVCGKPWLLGSG